MMKNCDEYISLKEIAEMLGENYSTIRHYKREFNVYLDARQFGRQIKYSPQNAELFREILDEKENGHTNKEIEKMLQDNKIKGQKDNEVNKQADKQVSEQVGEQTNKPAIRQVDRPVSEQAGQQASKQVGRQTDRQISKQEVDKIIEEVCKKLKNEMVQGRYKNIIEFFSKNIEPGLTALQKNQQILYQAIVKVNKRVVSMEAELGLDPGEDFKMDGIEPDHSLLEECAVAASYDPDLEPVLKSVCNGVSDKTAVINWINIVRSQTPCPSYAELATRLDNAGVPTLTGRAGWNRGSLSKMASENNAVVIPES